MSYPITLSQGWSAIADAIDDELYRQGKLKADGKFQYTCEDPQMTNAARLAVLVEEVGEVARAINDYPGSMSEQLGDELVQVAAVAVAWLKAWKAKQ